MRGSVRKRGDSFRARYRDDAGREHQRSFAAKRDAEAWLRGQLAAIHRGDWIDPAAGSVTFAAYAAGWLEHQHVRPATRRLQEMRLRLYVNPVLGELPLRQVRRSHVLAVVAAMVEAGLSPNVIRYAVGTLRAVLAAAVADRLVVANVAEDRSITLPRRHREILDPLTASEIAAIAAAIEPRMRALVLLGAATGLRSGELRGLTADRITPAVHLAALDVAPRQGTVRVDRQLVVGRTLAPCKTDASVREVSIGATTLAMLRSHVQTFGLGHEHPFVFTTTVGTPLDASQLSVAWTAACRRAGIRPGMVVHDLRHHHASDLLSQGINPAAVARRLGHANAAITMNTYAHCLPSDEQRVLDASEATARSVG